MPKIIASIILPTYNESGNIIDLVEKINDLLKSKRINHEIIVVDDNSPDKTGVLAQKYFTNNAEVRVVIRKERGLATAIKIGITKAVGEIIVILDSDFNHDPKLIPTLISKCQKYDFIIGSRFIKGGGMTDKTREILSNLFNMLVRLILGSPVHDNLSGYFAIRRKILDQLNLDDIFWGYGDYFIRLVYLAKMQKASFSEVPAFYKKRHYGESKSQFLNMFYDYLISTINIRFSKQK